MRAPGGPSAPKAADEAPRMAEPVEPTLADNNAPEEPPATQMDPPFEEEVKDQPAAPAPMQQPPAPMQQPPAPVQQPPAPAQPAALPPLPKEEKLPPAPQEELPAPTEEPLAGLAPPQQVAPAAAPVKLEVPKQPQLARLNRVVRLHVFMHA